MKLPYRPGPDYFDEEYYHKVGEDPNQLRDRANWLVKTFAPKRALEIGCGRGVLLSLVREKGIDAVGIDISRYAATVHSEFQLVADDAKLPFRDEAFDLVYGYDILEHNMEIYINDIVSECARVSSRNAFFSIALFGTTDDIIDPTHFTLEYRDWWIDKFSYYFEILPVLSTEPSKFILRKRYPGMEMDCNGAKYVPRFQVRWK